jgi:hypothetical protein
MKYKNNDLVLIGLLIVSCIGPVQAQSIADIIQDQAYNQCMSKGSNGLFFCDQASNDLRLQLMNGSGSGCYIENKRQYEQERCNGQNLATPLCQSIVQRAISCIESQFRKDRG